MVKYGGFSLLTIRACQVALRKSDPFYGYWFYRFYYEAFADPLSKLSSKFVPETDEAVGELLSYQMEM